MPAGRGRLGLVAATIVVGAAGVASAQPARAIDVPEAEPATTHLLAGIDHRGVPMVDAAVGLGDLATVGLTLDDRIAVGGGAAAASSEPMLAAWFRLGVPADLLGRGAPAVVLDLERSVDERLRRAGRRGTPFAELRLLATRRVAGTRIGQLSLTAGVTLADAAPHLAPSLRPAAALGWTPRRYPRTTLLADVGWAVRVVDEVPAVAGAIGWGVRYQVARTFHIDLAVRHRADVGLEGSTVMVRGLITPP
ncbi:MAG: hypothetical protein R2939_11300 [Kofleriaceae bacterium]